MRSFSPAGEPPFADSLLPTLWEPMGQRGTMIKSMTPAGDPKQAIYRWRGGDIAQFIRLLNKDSKPFQIEAELKKLEINYRSDEAIVAFNNTFFSYLTTTLSTPEIQSIYGEASRQQIKKWRRKDHYNPQMEKKQQCNRPIESKDNKRLYGA